VLRKDWDEKLNKLKENQNDTLLSIWKLESFESTRFKLRVAFNNYSLISQTSYGRDVLFVKIPKPSVFTPYDPDRDKPFEVEF
jgi:hypothetical protein